MGKDSTVEAGAFEKRRAVEFLTNLLFPRRLEGGISLETARSRQGCLDPAPRSWFSMGMNPSGKENMVRRAGRVCALHRFGGSVPHGELRRRGRHAPRPPFENGRRARCRMSRPDLRRPPGAGRHRGRGAPRPPEPQGTWRWRRISCRAACVAALPVVDAVAGLSFGWFVLFGVLGAVGDVPGMDGPRHPASRSSRARSAGPPVVRRGAADGGERRDRRRPRVRRDSHGRLRAGQRPVDHLRPLRLGGAGHADRPARASEGRICPPVERNALPAPFSGRP